MSHADDAQRIELLMWEKNNAPRPEPVKYAPGDDGYGPEFCDECDEVMPDARREHGYAICVPCKSAEEDRDRQYRR